MPDDEGIAPSVQHGADFIERCITREYKMACIEKWRELFGDSLADGIMNELRKRKKGKKKE